MKWGIDTALGIVPLSTVAKALRDDLRGNVTKYVAEWQMGLKSGDRVLVADMTDDDALFITTLSDGYDDGLVTDGSGGDHPAALVLAEVTGDLDPDAILDAAKNSPEIIIAGEGAVGAYRPTKEYEIGI